MQERNWNERQSSALRRAKILEAYRKSDLTQREFVRQHRIGLSTLGFWLRKAKQNRTPPRSSFIRRPNPLTDPVAAARYQVRFANGLGLEIGPGFREEELERLLPLLGRL